jgi:hypothetical protein
VAHRFHLRFKLRQILWRQFLFCYLSSIHDKIDITLSPDAAEGAPKLPLLPSISAECAVIKTLSRKDAESKASLMN